MEETEILAPDQAGIARAAGLLREGRLVAFPTETVYGLGADARQARAVAEIFAAKGRPRFNPLIVHVTGLAAAERLVALPETARKLAAAFWPGPLTLVAPMRAAARIGPPRASGPRQQAEASSRPVFGRAPGRRAAAAPGPRPNRGPHRGRPPAATLSAPEPARPP